MNEIVFLDSNGWIALLNSRDQLHAAAVDAWHALGKQAARIVVSDWIVAETGNGLSRTAARIRFPEAVSRIESSHHAQLLEINGSRRSAALALYADRADKSWGLTDCSSFVVMRELSIAAAFTSDRHFEQAGFRCLLTATT